VSRPPPAFYRLPGIGAEPAPVPQPSKTVDLIGMSLIAGGVLLLWKILSLK
jgi:hypothetical protein